MQAASDSELPTAAWAQRAIDHSPTVRRSRMRSVQRAQQIVQAARRLIDVKGASFTTQELVKEAGVAMQTFYKYFAGKDEVLLAAIEDLVRETCADLELRGRDLPDPISRLHFYLTSVLSGVNAHQRGDARPRFITTEHWRLHRLYPDELVQATRPFTELLLPQIHAATEAGLLAPRDPEYDAWLVSQLVTATFHHYEYATAGEPVEQITERLWSFCVAGLGGASQNAGRAPSRRGTRRVAT